MILLSTVMKWRISVKCSICNSCVKVQSLHVEKIKDEPSKFCAVIFYVVKEGDKDATVNLCKICRDRIGFCS